MDARKWRIHYRNGAWCVFEPGWVFHDVGSSSTFYGALWILRCAQRGHLRTKGKRET